MRVLGVDPGLDGGLAIVDGAGRLVAVRRMPTLRRDLADGTKRRVVDPRAVTAFITQHQVAHAIVEDVNAFGMGPTSAFSFGRDCGAILGVLGALDIPHVPVTPQKWKGALGLLPPIKPGSSKAAHKKHLKHIAIVRAQKMFPGVTELGHDGCAEAALIPAWWLLSHRPAVDTDKR